jgi:hypothetical protein
MQAHSFDEGPIAFQRPLHVGAERPDILEFGEAGSHPGRTDRE